MTSYLAPAPFDAESMARISTAFSWAYRADVGQTTVAVSKLSDAELAECIEAAERLKGWVHLQQMVRRRQDMAAVVEEVTVG